MATIDNSQLITTLQFVNKQLTQGGSQEQLRDYMRFYDKKMAKVNTDFYTTQISSDPVIEDEVKKILIALGISESNRQWGRYIGTTLTVHEFLQEIIESTIKTDANTAKFAQLQSFLELIETKAKISRQKALLFGLAVLFPILAWMPYGGYSVIEQILTAALFLPVAGLLGACAVGLYRIYRTTFNANLPLMDKIRNNGLILASTTLKMMAYGLIIATVATAAPIAAVLTAVAEGINLLKESFNLMQLHLEMKVMQGRRNGTETLRIQQNNARFDAEYSKRVKLLSFAVICAVLMTGLAVAICITPIPDVFLGVVVVLTFAADFVAEKYIDKSTKTALQIQFSVLEQADAVKENRLTLTSGLTHVAMISSPLSTSQARTPGYDDRTRGPSHAVDDELQHLSHSSSPNIPSSGYASSSSSPDMTSDGADQNKYEPVFFKTEQVVQTIYQNSVAPVYR